MTAASVDAAIDDPHDVAPLFRTAGFGRSPTVKQTLAARFSAAAADWLRRIKPAQIVESAMARRNQRGKGILTLHDAHSLVRRSRGCSVSQNTRRRDHDTLPPYRRDVSGELPVYRLYRQSVGAAFDRARRARPHQSSSGCRLTTRIRFLMA
jgi:hypothetical protein